MSTRSTSDAAPTKTVTENRGHSPYTESWEHDEARPRGSWTIPAYPAMKALTTFGVFSLGTYMYD
eukprot:6123866-Prymnesium_polylepis.1